MESQLFEIIYHLKVIELFLACLSGTVLCLLCMIALKYKGIL